MHDWMPSFLGMHSMLIERKLWTATASLQSMLPSRGPMRLRPTLQNAQKIGMLHYHRFEMRKLGRKKRKRQKRKMKRKS